MHGNRDTYIRLRIGEPTCRVRTMDGVMCFFECLDAYFGFEPATGELVHGELDLGEGHPCSQRNWNGTKRNRSGAKNGQDDAGNGDSVRQGPPPLRARLAPASPFSGQRRVVVARGHALARPGRWRGAGRRVVLRRQRRCAVAR
eukprot:gene19151-biopygen3989